jgi:hypothetical protein
VCPYEALDKVSNQASTSDWLKELELNSKAIRASSTSTTISCSKRGNVIKVVHDPIVGACIISEYLMDTRVGNKPLIPIDRYSQKSQMVLPFLCWGITRDMPIIIEKIEMRLDFHIYPIVNFSLLLGFPLDDLLDKCQGNLDEKLREATPAITPLFSKNSMEKPLPNKNRSRR